MKQRTPVSLEQVIKSCRKCSLHVNRDNAVIGDGNKNANIMFVGEAPGRDENEQGIPFVGVAGQKLRELISKSEINMDDVYIANICKCWPGKGNRTPNKKEIETCLPYLIKQIKNVKPEILFLLGNTAISALSRYKLEGIAQIHGMYFSKDMLVGDTTEYEFINIIVPLYHPSYLLRNHGKYDDDFLKDLKKGEKN